MMKILGLIGAGGSIVGCGILVYAIVYTKVIGVETIVLTFNDYHEHWLEVFLAPAIWGLGLYWWIKELRSYK